MSMTAAPAKSKDTGTISIPGLEPAPTKHAKLIAWVKEIAALTKPDRVHWCDGSDAEFDKLAQELIAHSANRVVLPGGELYREAGIILSPFDEDAIQHFAASKMFMSCYSVTPLGITVTVKPRVPPPRHRV